MSNSSIQVVQGFKTAVDLYQSGRLLLVDFVSRCLQKNNALVFLKDLQKQKKSESEIKEIFQSN